MGEQNESLEDAPSGEAFDLLAALKGKSSFDIFAINIAKIRGLQMYSAEALDENKEALEAAAETLDDVDFVSREIFSKSYSEYTGDNRSSDSVVTKDKFNNLKENLLKVSAVYSFREQKSAVLSMAKTVSELHFNLRNMLLVAAWSAFEGYMQGALVEIFERNPNLLSSADKKISIEELINNKDNVMGYIIAKEVDDIGHKNLKDLQSYIRGKLKIQFSNQHFERMQDVYFLRNVISHSAGFLRKDQLGLVPKDVDVCNLELKISQSYLNETLDCITKAVCQFHVRVKEKFGFSV